MQESIYIVCIFLYLFLGNGNLYDRNIIYDLRNVEIDDDTILLANTVEKLEKYKPDYIVQLDKNEWIGLWDVSVKETLETTYIHYWK